MQGSLREGNRSEKSGGWLMIRACDGVIRHGRTPEKLTERLAVRYSSCERFPARSPPQNIRERSMTAAISLNCVPLNVGIHRKLPREWPTQ
jgi:hypothetical protein